MPELTQKQENFSQYVITEANTSDAYRKAYNAGKMKIETIHRKAKELMDNGKVAARIKELRQHHMKRHEVTVDSLCKELNEDRDLARENKQASAAINAVMGKAKLHGLGAQEKTPIVINFPGLMNELYGDSSEGKKSA